MMREFMLEITFEEQNLLIKKFAILFKRANYSKQLISERFIILILGTFDDSMQDIFSDKTKSYDDIHKLIKELIMLREETSDT